MFFAKLIVFFDFSLRGGMLSLDPDFLRSFLAISETGSYAAAAERVNKTQSTVSAQMKRLEEMLGVSLFKKVGRRNVLTPEGQRLLGYARSMVRLNDETVTAFRPQSVKGSIKIGTSDDYAQAFLPRVLADFSRTHCCVEVEVVTDGTPALIPRLESEHFDALIVSCLPGDNGVEILRRDKLRWIGSRTCPVHRDDPLPLALWADGCTWRAMALSALARGGRNWRLAYTTSNAPLLATAVRDGLGVTVGPGWYLGEGLCFLPEMDAKLPLGETAMGVKVRPGASSPALEAFLEHLRCHVRADMSRDSEMIA